MFEQPWWLDAVAPARWQALIVRDAGNVVARMPYVQRRRFGLRYVGMPPLTQTLGPWLAPISGGQADRLDTEKRLLTQLIAMLPPYDYFHMNFSTNLSNWLPFFWAGFHASVQYTYRIEDLTDLDRIRAGFQEPIRRGIRKASAALEIRHDHPLEDLLRLDEMTYARQGVSRPVQPDLIRRLDAACAEFGNRRVLAAVDAEGQTHAALFVAWDKGTFYPLIAARNPDIQAVGANALLYWEAIKLASGVSRIFDFEGSMIEPIEHFIRGFGGSLTQYLAISQANDKARTALAAQATLRRLQALVPKRGQQP